jgi:dihydrofolate synthase/folylpolyglutamate synthase
MDYQETVHCLYNQLPFYQKEGAIAYKKDINNVINFFKKNGQDFSYFNTIHVGGTNGKGSVSHMLSSIIQESGLKIGLFTSPHLLDFRERIKIDGAMITTDFIVDFVTKHMQDFKNMNMSFFEMNFVMACKYFAIQDVDLAIIEVGLGGRLDATNVISPILSIITNTSLDHKDLLGDSLELITQEKAGIIKQNTPILIGQYNDSMQIIHDQALKLNSPIFFAKQHDFKSDLKGDYQVHNINTSVTAIDILNNLNYKISAENIIKGLANVRQNTGFRGRWDILSKQPLVVCDIAHNIDSFNHILLQLNSYKHEKHIILGFSKGKDYNSILEILPQDYHYYVCGSSNERIINPRELSSLFDQHNLSYKTFDSSSIAYTYLCGNSNKNDLILITGSTFIVSDMLKFLDKS